MLDAHVALIVHRVSLLNETHGETKETKHLSSDIKTQSRKVLLNCLGCFMTLEEPYFKIKLKVEEKNLKFQKSKAVLLKEYQ